MNNNKDCRVGQLTKEVPKLSWLSWTGWSTLICEVPLRISWELTQQRVMKYSWMNTTNVSFINFDPNINHLHLSVVCGNISSISTREMFLEDWLSSYNVTDINENVNKTRMKRQVDPGISTEQYRSGVTLTYTCGVARRFQNSTDLYDERYVVKYLNEKFLLNTKGPLSASGTRVGHQASSWIPVSGYSWITLNTICIMYQYISITSYPTTWYRWSRWTKRYN